MIQGTGRISPPLVGPGVAQLCELRMAHEVPERRVPAPSLLCAPHSQPEKPRAPPPHPQHTHTREESQSPWLPGSGSKAPGTRSYFQLSCPRTRPELLSPETLCLSLARPPSLPPPLLPLQLHLSSPPPCISTQDGSQTAAPRAHLPPFDGCQSKPWGLPWRSSD